MVYTFKLLHSWKQHANYGRDFLKLILIDETVNKFSVLFYVLKLYNNIKFSEKERKKTVTIAMLITVVLSHPL